MRGAREDHSGNEVERLRRQRATLAEFGVQALQSDDLDAVLDDAARRVSEAVDVDLVKLLELLADGNTLLVRAGINWRPGVVGHVTFGAHAASPGGYALETGQPVISKDLASERRFAIPSVLIEHGVRSAVNVVIGGRRGAWGVLEVDSRRIRDFDIDDINFLQNYANLVASAIDRARTQDELASAAETRTILLGELQHRAKNILANVRALAKRTLASSTSLAAFSDSFDGRLAALSRTQDLLTTRLERRISIRDLVWQELEAHGAQLSDSISIDGPMVMLSARAVQALCLAFHELATNAVKYGALCQHGGRIEVNWRMEPSATGGDDVVIRWREAGVPIEKPPARRGFGSEVIERSLPYMLGGTSKLEFAADGVECTIRIPCAETWAVAGRVGEYGDRG
jgi:two-component sensor histidine kinase